MEKYRLRTITSDIDYRLSGMLQKWLKHNPIENDKSVEMCWQFEQCQLILYVYGTDGEEGFRLQLVTPKSCCKKHWREVSGAVIDDLLDTVASWATIAQNER